MEGTQTESLDTTPEQQEAESDAAFASGYNGLRGEEPPKTDEPPKTESTDDGAAPSDPEPPKEPPVDEWANVPPKVKAEFDSIREQLGAVAKVPDRLRNIEGTLGGLSQLTKDLKAAVANATTVTKEKGQDAPTQQQVEFAAKSTERWKQLKEDFPDWAEAVGDEIGAMRAELEAAKKAVAPQVDVAAIKAELTTEFEKRLATAVQDAETRASVHSYLDFHHDGWKATVKSTEFESWFGAQPEDVRALGGSDRKEDAKKMLDLYAQHRKAEAEKANKRKRLERSVAPEGTTVTASTEDEDAAFERGYKSVRSG